MLMLSIIVYGLYQSCLKQKTPSTIRLQPTVQPVAVLLVASQVNLSMMNDSLIDDVLFIPLTM